MAKYRIEYKDEAGAWQDTTRRANYSEPHPDIDGKPQANTLVTDYFRTKAEAGGEMEAMANHNPEQQFRLKPVTE